MVKIIKRGECCDCCALMIANNDESGCRDFYGHDHPSALANDHGGVLGIADSESHYSTFDCELCGQNMIMGSFNFIVLG